ncbi:MAG: hypothetical protein ACI9KE_004187, partial [Polyangiales bacterium]
MLDGVDCEDGSACTFGDMCESGICAGTERTCDTPPAAECLDASILRTYAASGACGGGDCSYPASDMTCSNGCADGSCVADDACVTALGVPCAYFKASNTGDDWFGYSVSLDGDTLAVGAPLEASVATGVDGNQADNSAGRSGAAYVFRRVGGRWVQEAYLKASNTGADDRFGYSVSLDGDTLAIGAIYEDSDATGVDGNQADNSAGRSGAAYVFRRTGSTWSQSAYLKASNAESIDSFGHSVSLDGDTLAVGALWEASAATGVDGNQNDNSA